VPLSIFFENNNRMRQKNKKQKIQKMFLLFDPHLSTFTPQHYMTNLQLEKRQDICVCFIASALIALVIYKMLKPLKTTASKPFKKSMIISIPTIV